MTSPPAPTTSAPTTSAPTTSAPTTSAPTASAPAVPASRPFHLGWFTYFGPEEWSGTWGSSGQPWDGAFHVDLARSLERAGFDLLLLEDSLVVSDGYGGSREAELAAGVRAPRHDPAPLTAVIGAATRHLGVVTTLSTMAYPPFLLARLTSTLAHLSGGRFGWNVVTSTDDAEAQNLGLDALPPRGERYAAAEEYLALVRALYASWEPDAVVVDRERGVHTDHTGVHEVGFAGQRYRSRGPLTTAPTPQGRPVLCQAGGSPAGRAFAARHADVVLVVANGTAGMRAQREDVRRLAAEAGRDPDDVTVLFLVAPVVGETEEEARAALARAAAEPEFLRTTLMKFSAYTSVDLSRFDLDEPLPPLDAGGSQGTWEKFAQPGSGRTLRELAVEAGSNSSLDLVGTPAQIADRMEAAVAEVGGDGFLITTPFHRLSRHYVSQVCDGLVPELQRRGLTRTGYPGTTLWDSLAEHRPRRTSSNP